MLGRQRAAVLTPSLPWPQETDPAGLPPTPCAQIHSISFPSGLVPHISSYSNFGFLPQESLQLKANIIFLFGESSGFTQSHTFCIL